MIKEVENEERVMLSKTQFINLCNDYFSAPFTLVNYYFDMNGLLFKEHAVLRIRTTNGENPIIQLKIKGKNGDVEYHQPIDNKTLESALKEGLILEKEMANIIKVNGPYRFLASLTTIRREIKSENHILVIDENHYFNIVDFDLEVEAPSMKEAKKWMQFYCTHYGLKYQTNYLSKSRRVFKQLNNIFNI